MVIKFMGLNFILKSFFLLCLAEFFSYNNLNGFGKLEVSAKDIIIQLFIVYGSAHVH